MESHLTYDVLKELMDSYLITECLLSLARLFLIFGGFVANLSVSLSNVTVISKEREMREASSNSGLGFCISWETV